MRILHWLTAALCLATQAQALEISEILPFNEGGLQDEDLSSPGWIEIFNETASPVNLAGWKLTDSALNLAKWSFPSQTLAAGGYLTVFASGKNRAVAGAPLHTNFQLDTGGEYLALVMPDGVTKAVEFNPFPKLRRNVSWRYAAASALTTPVVAAGGAMRWMVPADASLDATWKGVGFNDAAWASGPAGFGFDTTPSAKFDLKTPTSNATVPSNNGWTAFNFGPAAGTIVPESGTNTTVTASVTVGSYTMKLDAVGATLVLGSRSRQGTVSDSSVDANLLNNMAEDFVFAATSNYVAGTPKGMDVTLSGFVPNTSYQVKLYAYDRASPAVRVATWTNPTSGNTGNLTFNGADGQLASDAAIAARTVTITAASNASGQIILQGRAAAGGHVTSHNVYLNGIEIGQPTYMDYVTTNVSSSLQGQTKSLYARQTFFVLTASNYASVRMKVRYDEGFIASLNGTTIISRNAPAVASWNAAAASDRPKANGFVLEDITVALPPGLLVSGTNVMAIQGFTSGVSDIDFLLVPTVDLVGTLPAGGVYYATPTPSAVNATAFAGLVKDTTFTVDRQYFTGNVTTSIGCPTVGAQIRYTLDGSPPTASTGTVYTTPLTFSTTAILRAAAFIPSWIPSNTDTQSFLSAAAIAGQSGTQPGWPATWGANAQVDTNDGTTRGALNGIVPSNYAMDQRVVTTTTPGFGISDALAAIPTISIAMAPSDFLGVTGIYQNPTSVGPLWERDCSAELIDPSLQEKGFHETCRIEVHGNSSRNPYRMQKHSMRLSFKGDAGASKLRYKFFPGSRLENVDKIILRATFTDGWGLVSWNSSRYRPDDSVMMRDVWMRRSWEDMGNLSPKSRYVHVMVNGLYWGVYDASEHIDDGFLTDNLGGKPTDWEVVSDFVDPDVSATSPWKNMYAAAAADMTVPANYQAVQQWLDPVNFADYYILHQYAECEDWPHHNGAAFRNKIVPGSKYKWLAWDQEISMEETGVTNGHNIDRISVGAANTTTARTPGALWQALRVSPEWKLLVADRLHALLNNDGPLSAANSIGRWQWIASGLDKPIVAESARWGDTATETPYGGDDLVPVTDLVGRKRSRAGVPLKDPYLRSPDWTGANSYVTNTWIPSLHDQNNTFATVRRFKDQGFFPATHPPAFGSAQRLVPSGYQLGLASSSPGTIYYTTNGTDPRQAVTGTVQGTAYTGPFALSQTGVVKARVLNGTEWSALTEDTFIVGTAASDQNLVISEIHYNPQGSGDFEFIELMNISSGTIDLTDVKFTIGISYDFAPGTLLQPQQRIVLVQNAVAFAAQYPTVPVFGTYLGKLDNGGEELVLISATGADIRRFTYADVAPWPTTPDGVGNSLTLIAPGTNPDPTLVGNWRTSDTLHGTPGTTDALPLTTPNLLAYALATTPSRDVFSGELVYTVQRRNAADATRVIVETSPNLQDWSPVAATASTASYEAGVITEEWHVDLSTEPKYFVRTRVVAR